MSEHKLNTPEDVEWLMRHPDMVMLAKYHDAGSCWQLIQCFRRKLANARRLKNIMGLTRRTQGVTRLD